MPMNEDQVMQFIRDNYSGRPEDFKRIADQLDKKGYKSRKTGRPLTPNTVRIYYYKGLPGKEAKSGASKATVGTAEALMKLALVRKIIETPNIREGQMIEMIRAITS